MTTAPQHAPAAEFFGRVGWVRAYAAVLPAVGALLLGIHLAELSDLHAALALAVAALLAEITARWLAHAPRGVRDASIHQQTLHHYSERMGVPTPRLLVVRLADPLRPRVTVRGWGTKTAILVDSGTEARWRTDANKRSVHLTHELGHLWARDLNLYSRSRALNLVSTTVLLGAALWTRQPAAMITATLLGLLSLLAERAYLRYREHVADVMAMLALDEVTPIRDQIMNTPDKSAIGRILGTHPGDNTRRAILFNPFLLTKTDRWTFPLLGLGTGVLATALATLVPNPVAALTAAGVLTYVLSASLVERFVFSNAPILTTAGHLLALILAIAMAMFMLDVANPATPPTRDLGVPGVAGACIAAAVLGTLSCRARRSIVLPLAVFVSSLAVLLVAARLVVSH